MGRSTSDYHDACLLESVIHLLSEAGRFDDALAILDERDAEYVDKHSSWFHTNRIGLLGEAGRYEEALAYAKTLPTDLYGLTSSSAWIPEQSGRVDEALGPLRADADVEAWEVAALLIKHGRAEEAMDSMPSIADLRAVGVARHVPLTTLSRRESSRHVRSIDRGPASRRTGVNDEEPESQA
ncbi:hypothetical protein ACFW9I_22075 [[Kitasatospora] papulosa]|uniref:hypothetical protein n=1 Tax=[Kitasatospora] papulosa TaxID=1464011 RepID=UPI00369C7A40